MNDTTQHFAMRCRERGITEDPLTLAYDLRRAFKMHRCGDLQSNQYVEPVMRKSEDALIWRFRVPSGIFYVLECNGWPRTIYTGSMVADAKAAKRKKKGRAVLRLKHGHCAARLGI